MDMEEIDLAGPQERQTGGGIGGHLPFDAIEIGQACDVVVRITLERQFHPALITLQDERAGADRRLRFIEVAVVFLGLLGENHVVGRRGKVDEHGGERMFGDDLHRVSVDGFDALHIIEARPEAGLGGEAL
jgi:hypothetical protein